jgi:hypothetical protein
MDKIKQIYPKLNFDHDTLYKKKLNALGDDHKAKSEIGIDHISSHDPSHNKKYTQWMVQKYHAGQYRMEDLPRVKTALSNFDTHKAKLEKKDINQYKHLSHVEGAVEPHLGTHASKRQEKMAIKHEGADEIHNDEHIAIHKLKTKEAACHYGAGTKWCTAAKHDNMFDSYNKVGPVYVIHDKTNNRKYQLHEPTRQFMDEEDRPVSGHDMKSLWKHDAIKKLEPGHKFFAKIPESHDHLMKKTPLHPDMATELAKSGHEETITKLLTGNHHLNAETYSAIGRHGNVRHTEMMLKDHFHKIDSYSNGMESWTKESVLSNMRHKSEPKIANHIVETPHVLQHVRASTAHALMGKVTDENKHKLLDHLQNSKDHHYVFRTHYEAASMGNEQHRDRVISYLKSLSPNSHLDGGPKRKDKTDLAGLLIRRGTHSQRVALMPHYDVEMKDNLDKKEYDHVKRSHDENLKKLFS